MSGIELAGLVLGALPLVIAGIEKYNESLDPIKAFYSWEKELPKYIGKLRLQHVHFEQSVRVLFAPITTEAQLVSMMDDPIQAWRSKELARELEFKLEESFGAYQAIMEEISKITIKIATKLDLERADDLGRPELESLLIAHPAQSGRKFEFRKRIKFGMNKKKIKGLLDELNICNEQLERLTDKSEKLEPYRRSCKPSFAQRVQRIQGYAKVLHSVLAQSWTCSCRASHNANLQLEQRLVGATSSKRGGKMSDDGSETRFSLWFWSRSTPWTVQEAQVNIVKDEIGFDDKTGGPRSPSLQSSLSGLSISRKPTRGVSFQKMPLSPSSTISQASTLIPDPPELAAHLHYVDEVKDICAVIHKHNATANCIAFALDTSGKLRAANQITDNHSNGHLKTSNGPADEIISLDALLNHRNLGNRVAPKLTRKERYILAVTLASSALQLYSTSWLEDQWSKKDVLFRRNTNGVAQTVNVEFPYVAQRSASPPTSSTNAKSTPKNTVLLALAVILLELYFGTPSEKVDLVGLPNGASSPWALLAMTSEWVSREEDNLSSAFATAVKSCLQFFHDPANSLLEPTYLQAAIEGIVLPLQDELMQFLGKTAP